MSGRLLALALCCCLASDGVVAQDRQERLEKWQRRLLDALEDARRPAKPGSADSWRGTLDDEGAAAAAEKARRRFGGRVLAVGRVGDGYRVRLLLDDGRVITTEVAD